MYLVQMIIEVVLVFFYVYLKVITKWCIQAGMKLANMV